MPDQPKIEEAVDRLDEVIHRLDRIETAVNKTNGRVNKLEEWRDSRDDALVQIIRKELQHSRDASELAQWRQLKAAGWRVVGGVALSSSFIAAVIGWVAK